MSVTPPKILIFSNSTVKTSDLTSLLSFLFLHMIVNLPSLVENMIRELCFKILLHSSDAVHL